jgi:DNA-binding CsgD family transcriptional regulator
MQLQQFMDISQAPDLALFERRLIDFAHQMDFGIVTGYYIVERLGQDASISTVGNIPMGFEQASHDREAGDRDPVVKRMKRLSIPFAYDRSMYVNDNADDLWEEQALFGYHTGITVALHLPGGKHFILGVDREAPLPTHDEKLTRLFADLQLLSVHAQDAAVRLMTSDAAPTGVPENLPQLTRREIQVLQWAMVGKTSSEIAETIHLSVNTVNFHIKSAMQKLSCTSRSQAFLKALSLGLL